jgi:uncharacterized protein (DUF1778 family)
MSKRPASKDKPIIATLRGSAEFKAYLERAAQLDRCAVSQFLERAAIAYAKRLGLAEKPPAR